MRMFRKLVSTSNDYTLTIVRLVLGVTFFMHGAQKMLGWFGGYGFHATMGGFTQHMGIPAPLAFLAICAEFFGGLGLLVGLLPRVPAIGQLDGSAVGLSDLLRQHQPDAGTARLGSVERNKSVAGIKQAIAF